MVSLLNTSISLWSEEETVKIGNDWKEIACYRSNGNISAVLNFQLKNSPNFH